MRDKKDIGQESSLIIYKRKNLINLPFLTYMIAPKIQYLDLSQNFLQNINQFTGCKFTKLKILYLNNNVINNIDGFSEGYFPVLQKLFLYGNQIVNLIPLATIHAPKLLQLKLGFKNNGNNINEIALQKLMQNFNAPLLNELTLDFNEIHNISFISSCSKFDKLVLIYLSGNKIQTIDSSILNQLKSLKVLSLKNNYICSMKFIKRLIMPMLEQFNISENYITETYDIYSCSTPMLNRISLKQNLVNDISLCLKCNWENLEEIQFLSVKSIYQKRVHKQIGMKFFMIQ